jgi:benzoylformate decarboxylase
MIARPGKLAIFEQFAADGITVMTGNPGTSEEGFLDVLEQRGGMDYVLALQEAAAVGIADGYARAARRPALVQLHAGVGLGNAIGMLYQAMRGHSPLVVVCGDAGVRYDAMDAQMAADLVSMAKPVTKWATRVVHPGSTLRTLRRGVKIAMTHPRGPVLVGLPLDVLDADTTEPAEPTTIPSQRTIPVRADLERVTTVLRGAKAPLILMGDGVADSGAQQELTSVAELLDAPVWGVCDSELNIDTTHPLYRGQLGHMFGAASKDTVQFADVVLVVGTYLFPEVFPLLDNPFRPGTTVVHIDLDSYEIAKNHRVDVAINADPKATLAAIRELLDPAGAYGESGDHDPATASRPGHQPAPRPEPSPGAPLADLFAAELAVQAPADLVVFDEALTASSALTRYLPRRTPGTLHVTRGGSLGVGIPGAIGVKLARPAEEVVAFTGDGGAMYTFQALWTAARYNIAARFVICNNRRYRLLDHNLDRYWAERAIPEHGYPDAFDLSRPDIGFTGLARALGVPATRVDKPGQVEQAVRQMFTADGPFLVDLDTREGKRR